MADTSILPQRPHAKRQLPFKTPWSKPSSLRTPHASSSRSSSITRSIFDLDLTDNGTPLTPPDTSSPKPEHERGSFFNYGNKHFSEDELRGRTQTSEGGSDNDSEVQLHESLAEEQGNAGDIDGFSRQFSGLRIGEQNTSSPVHRQTDFLKRQEETPSKHRRSSSLSLKPNPPSIRNGTREGLAPGSTRPRSTSPAITQRAVSEGSRTRPSLHSRTASANISPEDFEVIFPFTVYPLFDLDSPDTQDDNSIAQTPSKKPRGRPPGPKPSNTPWPPFEHFHTDPRTDIDIEVAILDIIKRGRWPAQLQRKLANDPNYKIDNPLGYIYIFTSASCPNYVKIGKSQLTPRARMDQWAKRCKFWPELIEDVNQCMFKHYWLVEILVQAELYNERRKFKCGVCKQCHRYELDNPRELGLVTGENIQHGEWYEVTPERALEVVDRWRRWVVDYQPLREDRCLRRKWEWKTTRKSLEVDWERWVRITWFDEMMYFFHCLNELEETDGKKVMKVLLMRSLSPMILIILAFWKYGAGTQGFIAAATVFASSYAYWSKFGD